jgi:hypothetical protein
VSERLRSPRITDENKVLQPPAVSGLSAGADESALPCLPLQELLPPDIGTFWGLLVLGLAYVHHSTTGFALPALLPLINEDLKFSDSEGALLTAGYTVRGPWLRRKAASLSA